MTYKIVKGILGFPDTYFKDLWHVKLYQVILSFISCSQRSYYVLLLKFWVNKVVEHLTSLHSKLHTKCFGCHMTLVSMWDKTYLIYLLSQKSHLHVPAKSLALCRSLMHVDEKHCTCQFLSGSHKSGLLIAAF